MIVNFDPVIFSLGPVAIRWYGLMYVIGFLLGSKIVGYLAKARFLTLTQEEADKILTYLLIGMIVFARLGYVFIYNWEETHSFMDVIAVWKGGLSFHGAAVGFIVATMIFAKVHKVTFRMVMDAICVAVPQGLFWGRIGNFMNMELYGRPTDSALGMVFASDPEALLRHPSQLYQALGEGLILAVIMFLLLRRVKIYGIICGSFLIGYGVLRFIVEYFRSPDPQMGLYFGLQLTMGQILCALMVFGGVGWILYIRSRPQAINAGWFSSSESMPLAKKKKKKRS
jgi:phosphatidylglycerol:prolipoprotein diacylglycerol transferase